MGKTRAILIICTLILSGPVFAQYDFYNKPKVEKFAYIGGSYFFGDIGGRQKNSVLLFGYEDLDLSATKPCLGAGIRQNFNQLLALRTGLSYVYLEQSDANSYSTSRHPRNLSFRTHILEASALIEFRVAKYNLNTKKRRSSWEYYVFGGLGGFYYSPHAKYKTRYVSLRPLTTEGQGLKPGTTPYSLVDIAIPIGGGLRYGYGFGNTVYVEMGYRATNTDYIDDVSTSYYSREELLINRGRVSAAMSYRGDEDQYKAGRDRGSRFNKDHYFLINIGLSMPLRSRKPIWFQGK